MYKASEMRKREYRFPRNIPGSSSSKSQQHSEEGKDKKESTNASLRYFRKLINGEIKPPSEEQLRLSSSGGPRGRTLEDESKQGASLLDVDDNMLSCD